MGHKNENKQLGGGSIYKRKDPEGACLKAWSSKCSDKTDALSALARRRM